MLKLVEHITENPSHNANIINFDDTCCSLLCILSIYICEMIQLYNNYLIELATYVLKVLCMGKYVFIAYIIIIHLYRLLR